MKGTRRPDDPGNGDLFAPGEYGRIGSTWFACTPNGHMGNLVAHAVVEHDDGTITVSPSILVTLPRPKDGVRQELWHGWLERGEWRSHGDGRTNDTPEEDR